MTAEAHSVHRSPKWWSRTRSTRDAARTQFLSFAEHDMFHAAFYSFAAQVAQQRYDTARAEDYRHRAASCRRSAQGWQRAAEQCRPWWKRLRRTVTPP